MNILFVHECVGPLGGAETNIRVTACELKRRGHTVALLHSKATESNIDLWAHTFSQCFSLADGEISRAPWGESPMPRVDLDRTSPVLRVLAKFDPDVVYI